MDLDKIPRGLYRHFKGAYYYVVSISTSYENVTMVTYDNVCKPELGHFTRPLDDFFSTVDDRGVYIANRKDNITGQYERFTKVKDLDFQLGSISTEQLIEELKGREDSPLQDLDVKGLSDRVFCRDYCMGVPHEETEESDKGVEELLSFNSEEVAKNYYIHHKNRVGAKLYKKVYIEVD